MEQNSHHRRHPGRQSSERFTMGSRPKFAGLKTEFLGPQELAPPPGLLSNSDTDCDPGFLTALPAKRADQSRSMAAFSPSSTSRRDSDGREPSLLVSFARSRSEERRVGK